MRVTVLATGASKAIRWHDVNDAEVDYVNGRFGIEFSGPSGVVVVHLSILEAVALSAQLRSEIGYTELVREQ
jgi:hypothetical protein